MLFIFFGWPKKTKDYGPAYPVYCEHCHNDVVYHYVKARRWFTLFFLPVLPLGFASHYLVCEVCGTYADLGGRDAGKRAKQLSKTATALAEGTISRDEFSDSVSDFEREVWGTERDEIVRELKSKSDEVGSEDLDAGGKDIRDKAPGDDQSS